MKSGKPEYSPDAEKGLRGFFRDVMSLMRGATRWRKAAGYRPADGRVTFVSPVAAGVMTFVFILVVAGIGLGLLYTLSYRAHFRLLRDNLGVLARIAAS